MFKKFISAVILLIIASAAYAASSASYSISLEVIDLGGASMGSSGYKMIGKFRDSVPQSTTSSGYTLEGRFIGIAYGTGVITTLETPVITSIKPNTGYNYRSYRVVINGMNISSDATASLISLTQPTINGTDVSIESTASMECSFDLTGAITGPRNVVVANLGYGKNCVMPNGFSVIAAGRVDTVGRTYNEPNPFNPSTGPTMIKYKLNTTAAITLYLFNQRGELIWQKAIPAGENGAKAGDNAVPWDAISDFNESVPTGVYVLSIVTRSGGATRELSRIKIAVIRQ
jgi:hypothetical protein